MYNLGKGLLLGLSIILLILGTACGKEKNVENHMNSSTVNMSDSKPADIPESKAELPRLMVEVNGQSFMATLYNNETSRALMEQMPLNISMSESNGQEKYYNFSEDLPSKNRERPQVIHAGDIMCWSGNCLVLFYKTYENTYDGYVRIGHIDDVNFSEALGTGDIQVQFSIQNDR